MHRLSTPAARNPVAEVCYKVVSQIFVIVHPSLVKHLCVSPVAAAAGCNTELSDTAVSPMPQLLAAAWLLRALSERCTLRFAGRLALAQGLRFLGPTGVPTNLRMFQTPRRQMC